MKRSSISSQSAILERAVQPAANGLTRGAAEALLRLKFSPADHRRMARLLATAQSGELTADQAAELENYRNAGRMLDLLHCKARQQLQGSMHCRP